MILHKITAFYIEDKDLVKKKLRGKNGMQF